MIFHLQSISWGSIYGTGLFEIWMVKIQTQYQQMEPIGAIWGRNKLQWWCCSVGMVTIWHYRAEWKFKCESTAFADQLCSWHPFRVSHLHLLEKYERELREKYEPGLFENYERGLRDSKFHFDCLLSGCHRTNPHQQAKRLFSIGIVNLMLITMMASDQTNYQIVRFVRF